MTNWIEKLAALAMGGRNRRAEAERARLDAVSLEDARTAALALLESSATFQTKPQFARETLPPIKDPHLREIFERYEEVSGPVSSTMTGHLVSETVEGFLQFGFEDGGEVVLFVGLGDSQVYQMEPLAVRPERRAGSVFHYLIDLAYLVDDVPLPPGQRA